MPHLPLSPEPTTPFHSGIRAVASYHTPQPSVDPHETLCERHVRSSSSLSAYRNDSDGALSKGDASSRQYAYNYSWVRCATEFRPSRTDCMQVLSDFTPSDAVNGPVSARDCCTRATNFFRRVNIVRFAPHAVTVLPVPYQKHFGVRFVLLFILSPGPSSPKGDVLAPSHPGS